MINSSLVQLKFIAGIIFNLHDWQFTRKFAISSMRDFGGGKSSVEGSIHSEIEVRSLYKNKKLYGWVLEVLEGGGTVGGKWYLVLERGN